MPPLKLYDVGDVRFALSEGRRFEAAHVAEILVRDRDELVRQLISYLATELREMGDDRRTIRGRPPRRFDFKTNLSQQLALWQFKRAVACRQFVDGKIFSPKMLAQLAIYLGLYPQVETSPDAEYDEKLSVAAEFFAHDMAAARSSLLPAAMKVLRGLGLSESTTARQGYIAATKRRIEEVTGVSLEKIERKLRR